METPLYCKLCGAEPGLGNIKDFLVRHLEMLNVNTGRHQFSRERFLTITKLEEAIMWLEKAIVKEGKDAK